MPSRKPEPWMEIAEQVIRESDANTLTKLISQLCAALDEEKPLKKPPSRSTDWT